MKCLLQDAYFTKKSIRSTAVSSVSFMISMIVVIVMLMGISSDVADLIQGKQQLKYLTDNNAHKLWSRVSDGRYSEMGENPEDTLDRFIRFYNLIESDQGCESFAWCSMGAYEDSDYSDLIVADREFFSAYKLNFFRGHSFYNEGEKTIPAVVGYDLRKKYKVGKEYRVELVTGESATIRISGILTRNAGVPSFVKIGKRVSLRESMIIPIRDEYIHDVDILESLFDERIYYPNNEEQLKHIAMEANCMGLYTMQAGSILEEINEYQDVLREAAISTIRMICISLLFIVASISLSIATMIEEKKRTFAIQIMLGATKKRIANQVVLQLFLLALPGFFLATIVYGLGLNIIVSLVIIAAICAITTVVATGDFRHQDIIDSLQKGEI